MATKSIEHKQLSMREEELEELTKRKGLCKWKTNRPKMTWGEFLLEATKEWEAKE